MVAQFESLHFEADQAKLNTVNHGKALAEV